MFATGGNLFICFICFVIDFRPPYQFEVVYDLLKAGADPNLKDGKEGRTALSYAVENVLGEFTASLRPSIKSLLNGSLCATPNVSVELKFPVELNSFSDASRVCAPSNESLFLVTCRLQSNEQSIVLQSHFALRRRHFSIRMK